MSTHNGEGRDPWLGIELRHLAALSAIESEGTFGEAALTLGYVQSAISGQVAMLERLTGTRLVERSRGPGPQRITPAGELLLTHSREILDELAAARARLASEEAQDDGQLTIALTPGLADRLVGPVLTTSLAANSGLEAGGVVAVDRDSLLSGLLSEEIDVGLTALPLAHEEIATAEISRRPLVLVVQPGSPLARRRQPPTLEELSHLPLVAWREGQDPSRIERELSELGLTPNVIGRAESSGTVAKLVAMGLGAAVLPRGAVADDDERLVTHPLDEPLPPRVMGLAWRRSRSGDPRVRRFIDLACSLRAQEA